MGQKEKATRIILDTYENGKQIMDWYMSMNNRNLKRATKDFTEIASIQYSYVFPILEKCIDKDQYDEIYADWERMCDEFEHRLN